MVQMPQFMQPKALKPVYTETKVFHLQYISPDLLEKILLDPSMQLLSPHGHFLLSKPNKQLWVRDTPKQLHSLTLLLQKINRPKPELLIKAKIISVDHDYLRQLGVLFQSQQVFSEKQAGKNSLNQMILPLIQSRDINVLNLQISALSRSGHANIISEPELITTDQHPALIESGEEVPYQEATSSGATSVAFKKAVLKLKVTPTLRPQQRIMLSINIHQDKVSSLTINGVPAIHTQQLQTHTVIRNKQTVVLGGIEESVSSNQIEGIPGLRKLPVLGGLFRQHHKIKNNRVLLIFITAKII